MIRTILIFILLVLAYRAVRVLFRPGTSGGGPRREGQKRMPGTEMVLDPECRTYIPRDRAIVRRINGTTQTFCSEACARKYEERGRS